MATQVHFEVFRRVGARGGWTLHEALSDRARALQLAEELMAGDKATGVKVVKETYNESTGDYLTLKIFEDGRNVMKAPPPKEEAPHALPCFKPDDFYSYHARRTMARLLMDFLARNGITITELIHRADLLEKLEATGTVYQFAIQKIAVAQASSTSQPVQQIVKNLDELATKALKRVYADHRKGLFPNPRADQFKELAAKLKGQANAAYLFNGALARHLKDEQGWNGKVLALLAVLREAPDEAESRALVLSSIDAIMAEVLSGSAALQDLLGKAENLGEALTLLVEAFLGQTADNDQQGLSALAARFAGDELPEARTAIAARIIAEIQSAKRLCPQSLIDELKTLRRLANRLVMGVGKYLSHEDLIAAFTLRSKRLVTPENLTAYLSGARADEKVDRLLFVEENIIGIENKRQLASYVQPVLSSATFENLFQDAKRPLLQRLQRLAQLQARVKRASFVDVQRDEIAARLDQLAFDVARRGKLFESVAAQSPSPVEKVCRMLKLASGGFFTEGELLGQAHAIVLEGMGRPGFLAGYFAGRSDTADAMGVLMDELGKAGIDAQTGLNAIAA